MPKHHLISPADAWKILGREISPLGTETLPLEQAADRWLAEPLRADRDIPPADRASMDGFAYRSSDIEFPSAQLEVIAEVAAGSELNPRLEGQVCARIFTGANLPVDADTVIPVELTSAKSFRDNPADAHIEIQQPVSPGSNIFRQGETAKRNDQLLPAGTRLGPRQMGVAAAVGKSEVLIYRLPRVKFLNTGQELLEAADQAGTHQTRNSNGPTLVAALQTAGFAQVSRQTIADSPTETLAALTEALAQNDAVIFTGGISAGRHDYVPEVIAEVGAKIAFRGVAIKPGKPQLFATTDAGKLIFGLPGNPLSGIVGLYEFVLPALRRRSGCPWDQCRPQWIFPLAEKVNYSGDRHLVLPAILQRGENGVTAQPRPAVGSADLATGGLVDGAILLPPNCGEVPEGTLVRFRPWGALE